MGLCTGQKIPYEDIMPQELQNLRKQMATGTSYQLTQGNNATPYPGPLTAPQDPLSAMASSIMMGMMGQAGKTGLYGTPTAGLFPNINIPKVPMNLTGGGGTDGGGTGFVCSQDGQWFPTQAALDKHWQQVHKKLEP